MVYGFDPISIQDFASIIKLTANTPSNALKESNSTLLQKLNLRSVLKGDAQESSKIMRT